PQPQFVAAHAMPRGFLAGGQQIVDSGREWTVGRVSLRPMAVAGGPGAPEPAALGMRFQIERLGQRRAVRCGHVRSIEDHAPGTGASGYRRRGWRYGPPNARTATLVVGT